MKKFLLILIICCIGAAVLPGQDLRPIGRDLEAMLDGIGGDIAPYLQQTVIAGEAPGRASLGDSRFFIGGNLGTTFTPGILTFIDEENSNFELLDVNGLFSMAAGESAEVSSLLNTVSGIFFLPSLRLDAGVRLPLDIEVSVLFAIIPGALTKAIGTAAGLAGFELQQLNIGVRVRKTLLKDGGGFPAVSIGTGYSYGGFSASYALTGFSQPFETYTLNLGGTIGLDTKVHATGIDLMLSKKLAIFYPYLKISPWYQWTRYTGEIAGFSANFTDSATGTVLVDSANQGIAPSSTIFIRDLSFIISAGFEMALGKVVITPGGSFNVNTKTFNAALNVRLQF